MPDPITRRDTIRSSELPDDERPRAVTPERREMDVGRLLDRPIDHSALALLPSRTEQVGRRLDEVRDAYAGPYEIGGKSVSAPPQFRMHGGFNDASMRAHRRELVAICARAGVDPSAAMLGYGKPEVLVKTTQALIAAGKLPTLAPPATLGDAVRKMQWDWGIGVDCVDYCMHAVSRATGHSVSALGLKPGIDPFGVRGDQLPAHFRRVDVTDAKPADILVLSDAADVGHRVIVRDHAVLSSSPIDGERAAITKAWGVTAAVFFEGGGPFHVLHVDSSWGAESDGKSFGGYRRDTWVFNEGSKEWMSFDPHEGRARVSVFGPAGERFVQAARIKGEP